MNIELEIKKQFSCSGKPWCHERGGNINEPIDSCRENMKAI
jgi:hypothetical protein